MIYWPSYFLWHFASKKLLQKLHGNVITQVQYLTWVRYLILNFYLGISMQYFKIYTCKNTFCKKQNKKKSYIEQDENTINLSQVVELLGNNQNDRWSPQQNVSRMHFLKDFFPPKKIILGNTVVSFFLLKLTIVLGNDTFSLFSPIYNYEVIVSSLCHVILND